MGHRVMKKSNCRFQNADCEMVNLPHSYKMVSIAQQLLPNHCHLVIPAFATMTSSPAITWLINFDKFDFFKIFACLPLMPD